MVAGAKSSARVRGLAGAGGLLRAGIVVAGELPRTRSTLLVRLMAGGRRRIGEAIEELSELPVDSPESVVASPILIALRDALAKKRHISPFEQELLVRTDAILEKYAKKFVTQGLKKGRQEGRQEGRLEVEASQRAFQRAHLRRVLAARKLVLRKEDEARVDACQDLAELNRWADRAVTAGSVADVFR